MTRSLLSIAFTLFLLLSLSAQTMFPEPGRVFRDDRIPRIDIRLSDADLDFLLEPSNLQSDEYKPASFYWDDGEEQDTVESVGFRLRGNSARGAQKKSFKVSFDEFVDGQKFKKLERLNINGEHNDPSIARSKLSWDLLRELEVPSSRANHVRLYINGDYYGLYLNVEHIDEEFVELRFGNKDGNLYKCLFPADLDYKGGDPELYKEARFGRRTYELKTNEQEDDYADLAGFIDVLNNTAIDDLPCELEKVFNVDGYLRAMVYDILCGNWDGPIFNKNNFYLYHNTETGQIEYLPYDLDNTWGIDFLGEDWGLRDIYSWARDNEPRPIYTRIMAVEEYRNRFSYYLSKYMNSVFNRDVLNPRLEQLRQQMREFVEIDTYYPRDYGFSPTDFDNAFSDNATGAGHVKYGLRNYVSTRRESASNQLDLKAIAPIITQVSNNQPTAGQEIVITARVEDDAAVNTVVLNYSFGNTMQLTEEPMFDDGMHGDGEAGDGTYGTFLSTLTGETSLSYFVQSSDDEDKVSRSPLCDFKEMNIFRSTSTLYINEIMASNSTVIADEEGEFDDWIELYNGGSDAVNLNGLYLTDNLNNPDKWAFPDITLGAGQFLLIWADDDEEQGQLHLPYKLSADGEEVGIFALDNGEFTAIDQMTFGPQATDQAFGRLPNGTGPFQVLVPTPGASNEALSTGPGPAYPSFQLSPNPFTNQLLIEFEGQAEVQITDLSGRLIWHQEFVDQLSWTPEDVQATVFIVSIWREGKMLVSRQVLRL
ncbi:MAG: CotH kinase family protein [Bacteroidota bacterium]